MNSVSIKDIRRCIKSNKDIIIENIISSFEQSVASFDKSVASFDKSVASFDKSVASFDKSVTVKITKPVFSIGPIYKQLLESNNSPPKIIPQSVIPDIYSLISTSHIPTPYIPTQYTYNKTETNKHSSIENILTNYFNYSSEKSASSPLLNIEDFYIYGTGEVNSFLESLLLATDKTYSAFRLLGNGYSSYITQKKKQISSETVVFVDGREDIKQHYKETNIKYKRIPQKLFTDKNIDHENDAKILIADFMNVQVLILNIKHKQYRFLNKHNKNTSTLIVLIENKHKYEPIISCSNANANANTSANANANASANANANANANASANANANANAMSPLVNYITTNVPETILTPNSIGPITKYKVAELHQIASKLNISISYTKNNKLRKKLKRALYSEILNTIRDI